MYIKLIPGFTDYKSTSVACGGASAGSGLDTWDVNAGDSVTAVWDTWYVTS